MGNMVRATICNSTWKAFRQVHGQSGDMGFFAGVRGHVLSTMVKGHDPKHDPYAFKWVHKSRVLQRVVPADAEDVVPELAIYSEHSQWVCHEGRWILAFPTSAQPMMQPADAPTSHVAAAEPAVAEHRDAQEIIEHPQKQRAAEAGRQPVSARSSLLERSSSSASAEPAAAEEEENEEEEEEEPAAAEEE